VSRPARIVLTPGEPAGVGPELCVQLAQRPHGASLVAVADPQLLAERAALLGLPLNIREYDPANPPPPAAAGTLEVLPIPLRRPARCGRLDPANAGYVLACLDAAVAGCLEGHFDALVTGPLHKGVINDAGIPFSGHTEYLAARCGAAQPVMMLATEGLRVALATTHLPLREVADAISAELLERVLTILDHDLHSRLGIERPRILVCGLNPHAGESGHLGNEELRIIGPTLERLRARGLQLFGPLPADTLFTPQQLEHADVVLAMYHDQGLPVLKHKGFGRAVNVTLGLPIVRTSVDHGTAVDLAGSGRADPGSLFTALDYAIRMAGGRNNP